MSKKRSLMLISVVVVLVTGFVLSDLGPRVKTAGQQHARKIKDRTWDNEPIRVVAVKGKGGRAIDVGKAQLDDDDWLRDLTISIKNVSDKNILFVELELHFLRPEGSSEVAVNAFPIIFGTPPALVGGSASMLPPNEKWQAALSGNHYANIAEGLAKMGYTSSIKEVEIITREVLFADQTKWSEGSVKSTVLSKKTESQEQLLSLNKINATFQSIGLKGVSSFSDTRSVKATNLEEPVGQCGFSSDDMPKVYYPCNLNEVCCEVKRNLVTASPDGTAQARWTSLPC